MHLRIGTPWLVACLLATGLQAQGVPRLVDSIEAPLVYLALGGESAGDQPTAEQPSVGASREAVQSLLADPAFDALLGSSSATATSTGRSMALVRGVLARSSGEIEIALTGVVPRIGQPLLVLRARLQQDEVGRLQSVLTGGAADGAKGLASRHRVLGGEQTFFLLGADGELAEGSGQQVELALVGSDLVVANDTTAIEELLDPARRTSADRRALSADRRFVELRQRVDATAGSPVRGSLLVYGDWARLGRRLQAPGVKGVPALLLQWSGLGSAQSVMAVLSGSERGFSGTVLLDFDHEMVGREPTAGRSTDRSDLVVGERPGIDGWLASALSVPARTLVRDLPYGGLGGLVLAVDLRDVAARSRRGARLLRLLRASFKDFGLDFERNVLARLGARGTVQLLFRNGDGLAATEIESVYSVRARSKQAAGDLFTDLRRAAEQKGLGRVIDAKERRSKATNDILELRRRPNDVPTCVATHGDTVLVAFDVATIDAFLEELRLAPKQRSRRNASVSAVVQKTGGSEVTGLFDLDFTPWFDHFAEVLAAQQAPIDLSRIPRRHVGYLDLQPRDGGIVLRICVLSSQ